MNAAEKMRTLIEKGLYGSNLEELSSLAEQSFDQCPALYGSLLYVFKSLAAEHEKYSGQGLPVGRYNEVVGLLTQPLLEALDAEAEPPPHLLDALNSLHAALYKLW
jgi:hypothetical protein